MCTVGKLIALLSIYPETMEVVDEQNNPFIHVMNTSNNTVRLSTTQPIGICNRSGGYVYPSKVNNYDGYSPDIDEDLYDFEYKPLP